MPFDPHTQRLLEQQHRSLTAARPDERKVKMIYARFDQILDRRPRPVAVAPDGEVLWPGQSPLVYDQASPLPEGFTVVVNRTASPTRVVRPGRFRKLEGPDDGLVGAGA